MLTYRIVVNSLSGYQMAVIIAGDNRAAVRDTTPAGTVDEAEARLAAAALAEIGRRVRATGRSLAEFGVVISVSAPAVRERLERPRAGSLLAQFGERRIVLREQPLSDQQAAARFAREFERNRERREPRYVHEQNARYEREALARERRQRRAARR